MKTGNITGTGTTVRVSLEFDDELKEIARKVFEKTSRETVTSEVVREILARREENQEYHTAVNRSSVAAEISIRVRTEDRVLMSGIIKKAKMRPRLTYTEILRTILRKHRPEIIESLIKKKVEAGQERDRVGSRQPIRISDALKDKVERLAEDIRIKTGRRISQGNILESAFRIAARQVKDVYLKSTIDEALHADVIDDTGNSSVPEKSSSRTQNDIEETLTTVILSNIGALQSLSDLIKELFRGQGANDEDPDASSSNPASGEHIATISGSRGAGTSKPDTPQRKSSSDADSLGGTIEQAHRKSDSVESLAREAEHLSTDITEDARRLLRSRGSGKERRIAG